MMKAVIEAPWELWSKQHDHHLPWPWPVLAVHEIPNQLVSHSTPFVFLLKMVRMPSDDPSPVYTPHESAVILTTSDVNPYRPSICHFRPTNRNLPSSQNGEQAATGIAPFLIHSAS
jgi:hypothetical protein